MCEMDLGKIGLEWELGHIDSGLSRSYRDNVWEARYQSY